MPLLLIDKNVIILVCGSCIITRLPLYDIMEAFIAYMSLYYLMDVDYPQSQEVSLSIMQYIIFHDKKTPADVMKALDTSCRQYTLFKRPAK